MPPRPGTVMILSRSPVPLNQQHYDGVSAIDAHSGDFGQYFGTFGPPYHLM